ncbi:hypothetical protein TcWFU_004549 [Taenia crassiceps]|uniref:Uncharacterized protein n=1 Tax=Taenia crassiceps TaxID=6207 RepID=A0ABR4QBH2_9CEST
MRYGAYCHNGASQSIGLLILLVFDTQFEASRCGQLGGRIIAAPVLTVEKKRSTLHFKWCSAVDIGTAFLLPGTGPVSAPSTTIGVDVEAEAGVDAVAADFMVVSMAVDLVVTVAVARFASKSQLLTQLSFLPFPP